MGDVLLVGVGLTAATALQSLTAKCRVVGLLRKSDPAAGIDDAIALARRHGIPVSEDTTLAGLRQAIEHLRPDCVVISSFDRIIPADLLARCPFVNVHYAPLPQYRGRANVNWAIINGESHTAITIHLVDQGLDSGNILYQGLVTILPDDTVADLYDHLNRLQLEHLGDAVARFLAGDKGVQQRGEAATYGCTRLPADGEIDWSAPTQKIDALIRAVVKPFPGAFTYYNGRRLTIWRARPLTPPPNYAGRVPGRVVNVSRRDGFVDVLTGDGVLRLFEVELQGGTAVPPNQIIRTVKATLGLRTPDLLARIETLERELAALREQMLTMGKTHAHV
jgi:methionyl-tRNA formyltransferase